jgi:hypothetical protein
MLVLLAALYWGTGSSSTNAAFALRPLCVARGHRWCDHDYPRWDAHDALYNTGPIPYACAPHRLLSWGRSPTDPLRGAPTLRFAPPRCRRGCLMYTRATPAKPVHKKHNTRRYGLPSSRRPWPIGSAASLIPPRAWNNDSRKFGDE